MLLKLMSSLVVSLSSVFHSECKPETNWNGCLEEFNHFAHVLGGLTRAWGEDGTKSFVTRSTGEITRASKPCAVAGG